MMSKRIMYLPLIAIVFTLISCDSQSKKKSNVKAEDALRLENEENVVAFNPQVPDQESARFPIQREFDPSRYDSIVMNLSHEDVGFSEPMSFLFERKGSIIGTSSIYNLEKIYLGIDDNSKFLFFGQNDDIELAANWESIYVDVKTYYMYGVNRAGDKVFIGFVNYEGRDFSIELFAPYDLNINEQIIQLNSPAVVVLEEVSTCPSVVSAISTMACRGYIAIYNTLASIDFNAIGAAGPDIAKKVISPSTIIKIIRGYLGFKINVPKVRDEFIIPIFKAIRQIKNLNEFRLASEAVYQEQTAIAYSDLIITSIDSIAKMQKMVPESFEQLEDIALVGAIIMLSEDGTNVDKPKWFRDIIMPIIGEFGNAAFDLVYNGSKSDFDTRVQKFTDLEPKLNEAVAKLCKHGNNARQERECLAQLQ